MYQASLHNRLYSFIQLQSLIQCIFNKYGFSTSNRDKNIVTSKLQMFQFGILYMHDIIKIIIQKTSMHSHILSFDPAIFSQSLLIFWHDNYAWNLIIIVHACKLWLWIKEDTIKQCIHTIQYILVSLFNKI